MQAGTIIAINPQRGMFIVSIDGGDHALFELLDGIDLEVGDQVKGDLHALGGEDLLHVEQRRRFSVYGQSGPSSLSACRKLL